MTDVTGVDMLQGKLRIELCADGPQFLARTTCRYPSEKLMTSQVYIGSGNSVWGTTIYLNDVVYKNLALIHNTGWLSVLGEPVLHGVMKIRLTDTEKVLL